MYGNIGGLQRGTSFATPRTTTVGSGLNQNGQRTSYNVSSGSNTPSANGVNQGAINLAARGLGPLASSYSPQGTNLANWNGQGHAPGYGASTTNPAGIGGASGPPMTPFDPESVPVQYHNGFNANSAGPSNQTPSQFPWSPSGAAPNPIGPYSSTNPNGWMTDQAPQPNQSAPYQGSPAPQGQPYGVNQNGNQADVMFGSGIPGAIGGDAGGQNPWLNAGIAQQMGLNPAMVWGQSQPAQPGFPQTPGPRVRTY